MGLAFHPAAGRPGKREAKARCAWDHSSEETLTSLERWGNEDMWCQPACLIRSPSSLGDLLRQQLTCCSLATLQPGRFAKTQDGVGPSLCMAPGSRGPACLSVCPPASHLLPATAPSCIHPRGRGEAGEPSGRGQGDSEGQLALTTRDNNMLLGKRLG